MILEYFILFFLLVVSLIDLKYKAIPSFFMTGVLFMVAVGNLANLPFSVLLVVFGLLIKDLNQGHVLGIADFKAFAIIGFMLSDLIGVIFFIVTFLVFSLVWAISTRRILKFKDKEVPYLMVFFLSYLGYIISLSI